MLKPVKGFGGVGGTGLEATFGGVGGTGRLPTLGGVGVNRLSIPCSTARSNCVTTLLSRLVELEGIPPGLMPGV